MQMHANILVFISIEIILLHIGQSLENVGENSMFNTSELWNVIIKMEREYGLVTNFMNCHRHNMRKQNNISFKSLHYPGKTK